MQKVMELMDLQRLHGQTLVPTLSQLADYLSQTTIAEAAALRDWPAFIALLGRC
jgi:hypothetical protein